MNRRCFGLLTLASVLGLAARGSGAEKTESLKLALRARVKEKGKDTYAVEEKKAEWDPKKTTLVICDMWDDHWCKSAAKRVGELAGPMDALIAAARKQGVFIIHAPSTCVDFYKDTPQRKLSLDAPFSKTPVPLSTKERWGTAWCWPDEKREGKFPIDDSDMGCDCATKCKIASPWTRQTAALTIAEGDAVTDNGQETWNLLAARGIDNVLICGVHLNMCVLGRPFAIRQMVTLGKHVALVRDMTDTMYNPEKEPKVSHFKGTELVVEHIEKCWCPSIVSTDVTGKAAFHFKDGK